MYETYLYDKFENLFFSISPVTNYGTYTHVCVMLKSYSSSHQECRTIKTIRNCKNDYFRKSLGVGLFWKKIICFDFQ